MEVLSSFDLSVGRLHRVDIFPVSWPERITLSGALIRLQVSRDKGSHARGDRSTVRG